MAYNAKDLKDPLVTSLCCGQGCHPLDMVAPFSLASNASKERVFQEEAPGKSKNSSYLSTSQKDLKATTKQETKQKPLACSMK